MKKKLLIPSQAHIEKCASISLQLRQLYKKAGIEKDGGITEAMILMCKSEMAETVICDAKIICIKLVQLYKTNKVFSNAINKEFEKEDMFCRSSSPLTRLNEMELFFKSIFNFYAPGFIEMHRLVTNPEFYTQDDLDYISETFVDLCHLKS